MHILNSEAVPVDQFARRTSSPNGGFTLIELIATIGVIAALVAIILPAVQVARETARRVQCVNNLKQIGLAIHGYAQLYNHFPSTMLPSDTPVSRYGRQTIAGNCFSPFARILPQMEINDKFNALNFEFLPDFGEGLTANQTVMKLTIAAYLCPSDPGSSVGGYGRINYRCNIGPSTFLRRGRSPSDSKRVDNSAGPFVTGLTLSPASFTDGLSNTVGLSERLQGDWIKDAFRAGGDYPLGNVGYLTVDADQAISICVEIVKANNSHESRGGESWCLSGLHFSSYNHISSPNHWDSDCGFLNGVRSVHDRHMMDGVFSASSQHPGGVNVLLMGGEVRFVRDGINRVVWRAVGTRASNEIASLE